MSRKTRITEQLNLNLSPLFLTVEDESHNHHVPKDAETHFKLIVASNQFQGLSRVARHRLVNHLLVDELNSGLHALSMHLYTPEEWELKRDAVLKSPTCKNGFNQ